VDGRLQLRIQRYGWDKAAPVYERGWARALEPAQRRLLDFAALRPGERVLDVACGTGLATWPAAEAVGATGSVLATDLSDEMVRALRDAAAARGLAQVRAERMDAQQLAVRDGEFDAALCALGLMYVPDPVAALREMARAVRPGGRVAAAVWGARARCGWAEIFPIVDARVESEVCPMFFQLGGEGALAMAMGMAGLAPVRAERIAVTIAYASGEEACLAAFAAGPVALAYSRFDARTRAEAEAEFLASIAGFRVGAGYEIPGEFVVAVGTRN